MQTIARKYFLFRTVIHVFFVPVSFFYTFFSIDYLNIYIPTVCVGYTAMTSLIL